MFEINFEMKWMNEDVSHGKRSDPQHHCLSLSVCLYLLDLFISNNTIYTFVIQMMKEKKGEKNPDKILYGFIYVIAVAL